MNFVTKDKKFLTNSVENVFRKFSKEVSKKVLKTNFINKTFLKEIRMKFSIHIYQKTKKRKTKIERISKMV